MTDARQAQCDMHEKLVSPMGREIYARRKVLTEPVFGQIKQAMGFRRFSLRSLVNVAAEWGIVCLCHNILKLFRSPPCRRVIGRWRPTARGLRSGAGIACGCAAATAVGYRARLGSDWVLSATRF